jgi:hypothetical protein
MVSCAPARERRQTDHLALSIVVTAILPHLLKRLIDQKRPDRCMVHGPRRDIPRSGKPYDAFPSGHAIACRRGRFRRLLGLSKVGARRLGTWRPHCSNTDRHSGALDDRRARRLGNGCPSGTLCATPVITPNVRRGRPASKQLAACKPSPCVGPRLTFASPLSLSVAGLGSAPLPVPLSGRILRMQKRQLILSSTTPREKMPSAACVTRYSSAMNPDVPAILQTTRARAGNP